MALRAVGRVLLLWAALSWAASAFAADLMLANKTEAHEDGRPEFDVSVSLMSDYVYRGVSLSERRPSGAAAAEARWLGFYASTNVQSVALPTDPAAEVTLTGGYRWVRGGFTLDLNANYFWYPGEMLSDGMPATSYWEYAAGIEQELSGVVRPTTLKGLIAYAPNVSGTGAWGAYAEGGVAIDLPKLGDIAWTFNATAGYWRFGHVSPMLGGFALPSYANWRLGFEFTLLEHFAFDLSYWDTNLSKEDCFVFTGDTAAMPGGIPDPASNPDGLRSRLCGAALVGTFTVKFEEIKFRR